jgi:hypothetical protein
MWYSVQIIEKAATLILRQRGVCGRHHHPINLQASKLSYNNAAASRVGNDSGFVDVMQCMSTTQTGPVSSNTSRASWLWLIGCQILNLLLQLAAE